jgi:hypothetical protein
MKLFRWLLLFALASPVIAQNNTRWDLPVTTVQAQGGNLLPIYAIPGAGVKFYSCSGSTCSALATTYISATSSTTCPTTPVPMQVTLNGSSTCVSNADPSGNIGGWFQTGQYMALITASGASYSYLFTIGAVNGAVPAGPAYCVQLANSAVTAFQCDNTITINPTTHTLNIGGALPTPNFSLKNLSSIPSSWTFDVTSPTTALSSISGASLSSLTTQPFAAPITSPSVNGTFDASQFSGADAGAKINACIAAIPSGGKCTTHGFGHGVFAMSQITLGANQTLECDWGQEFQPTTASEVMVIQNKLSKIDGCWFDTSNVTFSGKVLSLTDNYRDGQKTLLNNLLFTSAPAQNGTAIYTNSTNASTQSLYTVQGDNIAIYGYAVGLEMASSGGGFTNSTVWKGLQITDSGKCIDINPGSSGVVISNQFLGGSCQHQGTGQGVVFEGVGTANANQFIGFNLWDFTTGANAPIVVSGSTVLANYFVGEIDGTTTDTTGQNTYNNIGVGFSGLQQYVGANLFFSGLNGTSSLLVYEPTTNTPGLLEQQGVNSTNSATVWSIDQVGNIGGLSFTANGESGNSGFAACYSTAGKLGHCTSVVSSSGGCTCAVP